LAVETAAVPALGVTDAVLEATGAGTTGAVAADAATLFPGLVVRPGRDGGADACDLLVLEPELQAVNNTLATRQGWFLSDVYVK
jgi:hypothetical protein